MVKVLIKNVRCAICDGAGGIRKWPETEGGRAPCGSAARTVRIIG